MNVFSGKFAQVDEPKSADTQTGGKRKAAASANGDQKKAKKTSQASDE